MNTNRREFLLASGAALATSMLRRDVRGANDRIAVGFIGVGVMGQVNLALALRKPDVQVAGICDVYQPNMETALAVANKAGHQPKCFKDFRELLADKSIDAVCISTPDHWHAIMTVEACKAGKDVYVEKPACAFVDEAPKMVEAARKYNRVVQVGTQSRSSGHMPAIREVIGSGQLGQITWVRIWDYALLAPEGIGNPPDTPPPPGLDWDMWLGPAPMRPFNQNRCQVQRGSYTSFRYFWDYAGGKVTDNGVHYIDMLQMAFNETAPTVAMSLGTKTYLKDNRETPDTRINIYQYPEFTMAYECRYGNALPMYGMQSGIMVCGSKGTLCWSRPPSFQIYAEREPVLEPVNPVGFMPPLSQQRVVSLGSLGGEPLASRRQEPAEAPTPITRSFKPEQSHWDNFLQCLRTRQKPVSDIGWVARSTVTALLGNVALRGKIRVDYDPATWTSPQPEARKLMAYRYRSPWKLVV